MEAPCPPPLKALAQACATLQRESFPYQAWEPSFFEHFLISPHGRGVLAMDASQFVGFFLYQQILDAGEVLTFAVSKTFQGQGIGQRLLERAIAQARTLNLQALYLEVKDGNDAACYLYQKYGFSHIGTRPGYYQSSPGNPKDALLLRLDISK